MQAKATSLRMIWLVTLLSVAIGVMSYSLTDWAAEGRRYAFSFSIVATIMQFAAAIFFLLNLDNFKANVRRAYILLSVGQVFFGVAVAQLSIAYLFNLDVLIASGYVLIPFIVTLVLMFAGLNKFAASFHITSRLFSPLLTYLGTVALSVLLGGLPFIFNPKYDIIAFLSVVGSIFLALFFAVCARNTLVIGQRINVNYASSFTWLFLSFVVASVGAAQYALAQVFLPADSWYFAYRPTSLFFIVGAWLLMRTAKSFSSISLLSSAVPSTTSDGTANPFSIIVYIAGLASDPSEIDPILNKFRHITARNISPNDLTSEDMKALVGIYNQLERHMLKKEEFRNYTREYIRGNIEACFGKDSLSKSPFWKEVEIASSKESK